jgi:dUTP pyrophosphatase
MILQIKTLNNFADTFYIADNDNRNIRGDAGYDLYVCDTIIVEPWKTAKISLGISCEPIDTKSGYYLYPRSSISKTPLGLANSVGIIDNGYRGEICAVVRNYSDEPFTLSPGERYFQLCAPDLLPITIIMVNELSETIRGTDGFGSTGLN